MARKPTGATGLNGVSVWNESRHPRSRQAKWFACDLWSWSPRGLGHHGPHDGVHCPIAGMGVCRPIPPLVLGGRPTVGGVCLWPVLGERRGIPTMARTGRNALLATFEGQGMEGFVQPILER